MLYRTRFGSPPEDADWNTWTLIVLDEERDRITAVLKNLRQLAGLTIETLAELRLAMPGPVAFGPRSEIDLVHDALRNSGFNVIMRRAMPLDTMRFEAEVLSYSRMWDGSEQGWYLSRAAKAGACLPLLKSPGKPTIVCIIEDDSVADEVARRMLRAGVAIEDDSPHE